MYAEELSARLGVLGEVLGRNIERAGRKRLVDRDIDTTDPCTIHSYMGHQVSPFVHTAMFIG